MSLGRYLTKPIEELASQMAFTPPDVRREQLDHAERLYWELEDDGSYPLDYVIYRLTSYRADGSDRPTILVGEALRRDLLQMVEQVSETLDDSATRYEPAPLDLDGVCDRLGVTAKTISRYRKEGLFARRLAFGTGKRRRVKLAFLPDSVERFTAANTGRLSKARAFERIDDETRFTMILRARRIASRVTVSPFRVAGYLAGKYPYSTEAIRKMLIEHDRRSPRFAIFRDHTHPLTERQRRVIARAYRRGVKVSQMCLRFGKTRDAIYRAINHDRARALQEMSIRYVANPTFELPNADQVIMDSDLSASIEETQTPQEAEPEPLSAEQERTLFARYNYVKYSAEQTIADLDRLRPRAGDLDRAETLLRHARHIKQQLSHSYIYLVVATARRHLDTHTPMQNDALTDLIGEGNLILLHTIETFDIARGNRFSTYLTWALMRRFAQHTSQQRTVIDATLIDRADASPAAHVAAEQSEQVDVTLRKLLADLDDRERMVIVRHYGLQLSGENDRPPQTLAQIGAELAVSAERARQIEKRAVKKLQLSATTLGLSLEQILSPAD